MQLFFFLLLLHLSSLLHVQGIIKSDMFYKHLNLYMCDSRATAGKLTLDWQNKGRSERKTVAEVYYSQMCFRSIITRTYVIQAQQLGSLHMTIKIK